MYSIYIIISHTKHILNWDILLNNYCDKDYIHLANILQEHIKIKCSYSNLKI